MQQRSHQREDARPRRHKAWPWLVMSFVVLVAGLAALQFFVIDYTPNNIFPGEWYCFLENTDYTFTEDGFTVKDEAGNELISGTYRAGWRFVTLTYTSNGQQIVAKTRYTLHDNGQLVLNQVNGSQIVLTRP